MNSKEIAVLEDNWLAANFVKTTLAGAGYVVCGPVATADEFCKFLEAGKCLSAAVLDYSLAEDTCHVVAMELSKRKIPFVMLTGYKRPRLSVPAAAWLTKPCSPNALVAAVSSLVTDEREEK